MAKQSGELRRSHEYERGHTDWELRRLNQLIDPVTRQFTASAGVVAGMRVLDIGSGAGNVAFLTAALVGASGEVVGTDRSATAVTAALAGCRGNFGGARRQGQGRRHRGGRTLTARTQRAV
jgi:SAM-dependent methyltransferase